MTQERFQEEMKWATKFGLFEMNPENTNQIIVRTHDKQAYRKIHFLKQLLQCYIDSYYIVLITINELMEKGIQVELSHIVPDLHQAI